MRFPCISRFTLGEVVVLVAKASDKKDKPYLMFRVNRLCIDAGSNSIWRRGTGQSRRHTNGGQNTYW